jgi:hypothetical protein
MTNIIKFQSPFERLKDNNHNPEIALIKAIILQAIIDATNISSSKEARRDEIDAKAWIYGGSEDFELMCEYINYNVSNVRKIAREIQNLHRDNMKTSTKTNKKHLRKKYIFHSDLINEELLDKKIRSYF